MNQTRKNNEKYTWHGYNAAYRETKKTHNRVTVSRPFLSFQPRKNFEFLLSNCIRPFTTYSRSLWILPYIWTHLRFLFTYEVLTINVDNIVSKIVIVSVYGLFEDRIKKTDILFSSMYFVTCEMGGGPNPGGD